MYYASVTIVDVPISVRFNSTDVACKKSLQIAICSTLQVVCCLAFTIIIYLMTGQPLEWNRAAMFTAISVLTVFVAQSFGLMIGAACDVVVSETGLLEPTFTSHLLFCSNYHRKHFSSTYWPSKYRGSSNYSIRCSGGVNYSLKHHLIQNYSLTRVIRTNYPLKLQHIICLIFIWSNTQR